MTLPKAESQTEAVPQLRSAQQLSCRPANVALWWNRTPGGLCGPCEVPLRDGTRRRESKPVSTFRSVRVAPRPEIEEIAVSEESGGAIQRIPLASKNSLKPLAAGYARRQVREPRSPQRHHSFFPSQSLTRSVKTGRTATRFVPPYESSNSKSSRLRSRIRLLFWPTMAAAKSRHRFRLPDAVSAIRGAMARACFSAGSYWRGGPGSTGLVVAPWRGTLTADRRDVAAAELPLGAVS